MNKENTAIEKYNSTCMNCLKETEEITKIKIHSLGYGSSFDNLSTQINLCEKSYQSTNLEWWKLEVVKNNGYEEEYKYETDILNYISKMPLAGQELFWNRFAQGDTRYMASQDWIDYKLGILPHEKCKEYSLVSPEEKQAYNEKFPTCQHPANRIFKDNSKGCWCPFGANGEYGQETKPHINILQTRCYKCKQYIKRSTPIRDISDKDWNDYKTYYVAKLNQEKYRQKFE